MLLVSFPSSLVDFWCFHPYMHLFSFRKLFVTCICICGCPVQKSKIFLLYITIASPHSYPRPVLAMATRNVLYPTLSFFLYLGDPCGAPSTSVLAYLWNNNDIMNDELQLSYVFLSLTAVDCGNLTDPANGQVNHTSGTTFRENARLQPGGRQYSHLSSYRELVWECTYLCRYSGIYTRDKLICI